MNTFFSDKIILWRKMTKIWLKIWLKVKENGTKKFKLAKMVAKEKKILVRTLACIINCFTTANFHDNLDCSWAAVVDSSGLKVIKLFSCSTQLSMKFVLLINLKLLIIANSFSLDKAEHEILSANKYEIVNYCWHFHIY